MGWISKALREGIILAEKGSKVSVRVTVEISGHEVDVPAATNAVLHGLLTRLPPQSVIHEVMAEETDA